MFPDLSPEKFFNSNFWYVSYLICLLMSILEDTTLLIRFQFFFSFL